jgi:regulator of sigma E protease
MIITGLVFLLILSVLVLIHEAGHFFVAKKFGIKVEEFGFGLPLTKALFSVKKGETRYSFYPALIGGFVKLYGEDEAGAGRVRVTDNKKTITDNKKNEHRAFYSRPAWQRLSVIIAGVVMNTILAVVIYYAFLGISNFRTELPLLGDHKFFAVNQENKSEVIISDVVKDSPAGKAGIAPFSKVISVNGQENLSSEFFVKYIKEQEGKEVVLELLEVESGVRKTVRIVPRVDPPEDEGALGVSFFPIETAVLHYQTPAQKIFSGFTHPANLMSYNFDIMGDLLEVSIREKTAEPISQGVSGPVGIFSVVGDVISIPDVRERVLQILNLTGLLSISLAFFNILPIPGLDGGRLFFILVETVTRKRLNPRFEAVANAVGIAVLIGLIIIITFKDIGQFF